MVGALGWNQRRRIGGLLTLARSGGMGIAA